MIIKRIKKMLGNIKRAEKIVEDAKILNGATKTLVKETQATLDGEKHWGKGIRICITKDGVVCYPEPEGNQGR